MGLSLSFSSLQKNKIKQRERKKLFRSFVAAVSSNSSTRFTNSSPQCPQVPPSGGALHPGCSTCPGLVDKQTDVSGFCAWVPFLSPFITLTKPSRIPSSSMIISESTDPLKQLSTPLAHRKKTKGHTLFSSMQPPFLLDEGS